MPTILPTCPSEAVETPAQYGPLWRLAGHPKHGLGRLKTVVDALDNPTVGDA